MILKTRGRPKGPDPLFAEHCSRLEANALFAKARGVDVPTDAARGIFTFDLRWDDWRGPQYRKLSLTGVTLPQPFGGQRWWLECPHCRRRCGMLFLANRDGPVFCRTCGSVRYLAAYPGRRRPQGRLSLVQRVLEGYPDHASAKLNALLAKRRRGVRRGRRVLQRAARESTRFSRYWDDFEASVKSLARQRGTEGRTSAARET